LDGVANFAVSTRLSRILGEGYRSSEAALEELVDNAWDADARNVWISLPAPLSADPITLRDDGAGMTALEVRTEYLNIASDKRTRTGNHTPKLSRKVKGRKGTGKFAGLSIANRMEMTTRARGVQSTLQIDKRDLIDNQSDLEKAPLPFAEEAQDNLLSGTTIVLS
jgi:HSP90 family molecular chaperone